MIRTSDPAQAAALTITDALIERFGLLIIIVLGETITGVVAGLASEPFSGLALALVLLLSIPWTVAVGHRLASSPTSRAAS